MEDYNTATLPHKKFYDLDLYERRRLLKAAKKGKTLVRAPHTPWYAWTVEMLQSRLPAMASQAMSSCPRLCPLRTGGREGKLQR